MQPYLIYFHSILRYFILLFAVVVSIQSLVGMMGRKPFKKSNKMTALALLIFCDLQLLFGLCLYYFNVIATGMLSGEGLMKDPGRRFWAVEHSVGMIIAIVLVHMGYATAKKNIDADRKHKRIFWYVFIALVIFFAMIPWEGKQVVGRPNIPTLHT